MSEKTWTFRHTFDVSEDFLTQSHVDLLLDGIDTIATISVRSRKTVYVADDCQPAVAVAVDVTEPGFSGPQLVPDGTLQHRLHWIHCSKYWDTDRTQINGHEVLATDNAFRSYSLDAKPHLKAGQNQLQVMIEPASEFTLPSSNNCKRFQRGARKLLTGTAVMVIARS